MEVSQDPGRGKAGARGVRTGLVGRDIQASRSPRLHESEGSAQGLDLTYALFDFSAQGRTDDELASLLRQLAAEGYSGVNITYPFKQFVIPLLDELAESAAMVGAVNTVEMRNGRLIGHNTDMTGFRESLIEGLPGRPLGRILQLGAGGAGSAVANALLSLETAVLEIADIDDTRSLSLTEALTQRFGSDRVLRRDFGTLETNDIDGIVNTTPMGMARKPSPAIPPALILARHWIADIVYFPLETEMLKIARARGCRVLDGSGMVIAQAALAFEIFTELKADKDRMRQSFIAV